MVSEGIWNKSPSYVMSLAHGCTSMLVRNPVGGRRMDMRNLG